MLIVCIVLASSYQYNKKKSDKNNVISVSCISLVLLIKLKRFKFSIMETPLYCK